MSKASKSNSIRIIAGQWRGRRLPVLDSEGLRPTTDRVRETVFNWLMYDVQGARVLDLFAGSGALGFEALSRGASYVQFVEQARSAAEQLQKNIATLAIDSSVASVLCQDSRAFLNKSPIDPYDLIFLDPPFQSTLLGEVVISLEANNFLSDKATIYVEYPAKHVDIALPNSWQQFKTATAGRSRYSLYRRI